MNLYRNFKSRGNRPQNSGFRPRGGSNGGFGRTKTFNPELFINTKQPENLFPQTEYQVVNKFEDFPIQPELLKNVLAKGYVSPTPIQDQAVPGVLAGRDLIGLANTGTGKTAAFLIPLINKVLLNRNERILIVAPTRELAFQIREEFIAFSRNLNVNSVLAIGGTNMQRQKDAVRHQNYNFLIGTPGRLKDLAETHSIHLNRFSTVVLDEADHMVDIGFIQDIRYLISLLPDVRQSLFFSATIDGKVASIIQTFVKDPITVSVKTRETAENVTQQTVRVQVGQNKIDVLHDMLRQEGFEKVLIFGRTKWGVQKLSDELVRRGIRSDAIHGNKNQNQRLRTLDRFKKDEIQVLLATDVASRGLDIPNVSHVINFELPESQENYVHRIGRTGRADKKGVAITFV